MNEILGAARRGAAQHMVDTMLDKPVLRALPALALMLAASTALAQTAVPTPRLKPAPAHYSEILQPAEFQNLRLALKAAERGDWSVVRSIESALTDPAAQKILLWRIGAADERTSFRELTNIIGALEGWPGVDGMRRDAEYALGDMPSGAVSSQEIVRWFSEHPPQTGEGKVAHAEALFALGLNADGAEVLRDAWRENTLRTATQRRVLDRYSDIITQEDTLERVDFLAWADQRNAVRMLMPTLPAEYRRLYEARIALASRSGDVDALIRAVPASLQADAGLLYERARWRRRLGNDEGTIEALLAIQENPESLTGRSELWRLRHIMAREAFKTRDYADSYALSRDIGLTEGADFAEAEFLAGWVALRFLDQPEVAESHFYRLAQGVSTPVSLSRGWYWLGRARAANGDAEGAQAAYQEGAQYLSTYYGQLALSELDSGSTLDLPPDPEITDEVRARFEARDLTRALRMLGEMDEENLFAGVAYHLEDQLEEPLELALLTDLAWEYGMNRPALRVAKSARNRTLGLYERAFPLAFQPPEGANYVEPALALAISRQETEFEPRAVSGANARGLMQLIPATAQTQARREGLPYRYNWLLDDPGYNARLGSSHLKDLIENYNGSLIISMAAYNAGPGNARRWLEEHGDPRAGEVDPIDWVELISYGETRNYIQRVMENYIVYRARLNGDSAPLTITEDIRRGEIPQSAMR